MGIDVNSAGLYAMLIALAFIVGSWIPLALGIVLAIVVATIQYGERARLAQARNVLTQQPRPGDANWPPRQQTHRV